MEKKLITLDLETTGISKEKSAIIQIAGIIQIGEEVKEKFNFRVKPFSHKTISMEALSVTGVAPEDLNGFPEPGIVYKEFTKMLGKYVDKFNKKDKFHMIGYNCQSFDSDFLRQFFIDNSDRYYGSWFWPATLDVMVLAADALVDIRGEMPNFQLHTVAKEFGIKVDEDKLHDAMYDIELTKKVYDKIKRGQNVNKSRR